MADTTFFMTTAMRDFLIEHIDRPVPVLIREDSQARRHLRARAMGLGLVHPYPWGAFRPHETRMTDKGKETLCKELANWADALTRAQEHREWSRMSEFLAPAKVA